MTEEQILATSDLNLPKFTRLMRMGQIAVAGGNRRRAHLYWRRAASLCPSDEQVWLALLGVLDDPADRQVCLHNILAINPQNELARAELGQLGRSPDISRTTTEFAPIAPLPLPRPLSSVRRRPTWFIFLSIIGLTGIIILVWAWRFWL